MLIACRAVILNLHIPTVKQERIAKKGNKKPKAPKAAGEAFLKTLFAH